MTEEHPGRRPEWLHELMHNCDRTGTVSVTICRAQLKDIRDHVLQLEADLVGVRMAHEITAAERNELKKNYKTLCETNERIHQEYSDLRIMHDKLHTLRDSISGQAYRKVKTELEAIKAREVNMFSEIEHHHENCIGLRQANSSYGDIIEQLKVQLEEAKAETERVYHETANRYCNYGQYLKSEMQLENDKLRAREVKLVQWTAEEFRSLAPYPLREDEARKLIAQFEKEQDENPK
jgi:uncharacterized protein (DUF2267 family)